MSAKSESTYRRKRECSGNRQARSPLVSAARSIDAANASSLQNQPAYRSPSAIVIAPVSVAKSATCVAPCSRAWWSASARMSRPSASVFVTSIVFPFDARRMSPGLKARASWTFSVEATTLTTRSGSSSSAIAAVASITAAPPAMSPFMSCIRSACFREMPPESNVIALPTRPSVTSVRAAGGS